MLHSALRITKNIEILSGSEAGWKLGAFAEEKLIRLFSHYSLAGIAVKHLRTLDGIAILGCEIKFVDSPDANAHGHSSFFKFQGTSEPVQPQDTIAMKNWILGAENFLKSGGNLPPIPLHKNGIIMQHYERRASIWSA